MPTSFRSVAYGATRHRVVRHPGPKQQYVSAAQAAARGELAQGQPGMFGDTYGTNPASPGAGGSDVEGGLASSVGLGSNPFKAGITRQGQVYSNIYNPAGVGTLFGAALRQSGGGAAVAQQIGQHYGLDFGNQNPFRVGGPLYARGTPAQWVSQEGAGGGGGSEPQSGSGRPQHFDQGDWDQAIVDVLVAAAVAYGAGQVKAFPGKTLLTAAAIYEVVHAVNTIIWGGASGSGTGGDGGQGGSSGTEYPVGPGSGVSPKPGYYPRVTPGQSGRPTTSLLMRLALVEAIKRIGQQAHSPRGSDSGGGGGTSTAPERLFFHGAQHWYDVVAGHR